MLGGPLSESLGSDLWSRKIEDRHQKHDVLRLRLLSFLDVSNPFIKETRLSLRKLNFISIRNVPPSLHSLLQIGSTLITINCMTVLHTV